MDQRPLPRPAGHSYRSDVSTRARRWAWRAASAAIAVALLVGVLPTISYALYHVLIAFTGVDDPFGVAKGVGLRWLTVAGAAVGFGYVAAAVSLMGATRHPLALGRTVSAQIAASFGSKLYGAGAGSLAVTELYLRAAGLPPAQAADAAGLPRIAGAAVHTLALAVAVPLSLRHLVVARELSAPWVMTAGAAGIVLLTGALTPALFRGRLVPAAAIRSVRTAPAMARQPAAVMALILGAAGVTAARITVLAALLEGAGAGVALSVTIALYLVVSALGALVPSPGGLGFVEPALAVGLVIAGSPAAAALVSVILFRVLSFWLPMAPAAFAARKLGVWRAGSPDAVQPTDIESNTASSASTAR